ncbi:MAG TPA: cytochrome P450 [Candidatus Nanopelagicales bacterium]
MPNAAPPMPPAATIPRVAGLPVLGNTPAFLRDARALVLDAQAKHGDVFEVRILGQAVTVLMSPQATKEVYVDRRDTFSSERGWSFTIGPLFARGLMLRDFDDHHLHRRVMQHAFRRAALAGYMQRVNGLARQHVAAAVQQAGPDGVDVYTMTKRLTLDIAAQVFVGLDLGREAQVVNDAFVAMMRASVWPVRHEIPGTPFARGMAARRRLQALLGGLVAQRRAAPEGADLLSRLAHATTEAGRPLATDEVVDHMIFLLLAAHDTTTATLTVMLWHLSQQPAWQDRVAAELGSLAGQDVTIDNHKALTDTELVMAEALRLSPPVPFSPRGVVRDCEVDGVPLRGGQMIALASLGLHRHPAWWTEPDRFDPQRFAPDRAEDRQHSHLYVPFGGGAHICLGNHLAELMTKAVMAAVLAEHRVTARAGQRMEMAAVPIPKPRGGLVLTIA